MADEAMPLCGYEGRDGVGAYGTNANQWGSRWAQARVL